jgi:hypothetical protein
MGSHGVDSEVARHVIPFSSTSFQPTIELRPPQLLLTKIISKKPQTTLLFDFSTPKPPPPATSIVISKSDTLNTLSTKIRRHLSMLQIGQIRCYKFTVKRTDVIPSEISVLKASKMELQEPLEFTLLSKTVGEIGIVEPFIGIAVEWKSFTSSFPMDEEIISASSSSSSSSSSEFSNRPATEMVSGYTLGAMPNSQFTALNSRGRQKALFDVTDDDDNDPPPSLGRINGQIVSGPLLPGSWPRTSPPNFRSSSVDGRAGERIKTSFNSRFSSQPPKEDRVRGTTGLNNLGMNPSSPCMGFGWLFVC